jgi:hypothetical protein
MPKEINPRVVFERMFGSGYAHEDRVVQARRRHERRSILDYVLGQAHSLQDRVGIKDRQKLDEYFTAIREVERRLEVTETQSTLLHDADITAPAAGIPGSYRDHIRLLSDMMILAFQSDVTRVSTFMYASAGSNRNYRFIGVPEGHHELSHHAGDLKKQAKIAKINRFHIEQFAYLLGRLQSIREGDGTLLDNCMIVYGSGISDGNKHNHEDLPILLAGRGGGTIDSGRHVRYPNETPLSNLYLSLLDRVGAHAESHGDSTGRLDGLNVRVPRV